ncbi:MAG: prolipoprotein diacylglyceryl transferase [Firmicutes bacterium HGW-Firmicutes-14]|nr:MAG: prolipoprotein diacylglyceryl transferase [Firmicutes bacterium HGW-Firmicutes-14]
MYPVLFTIGSFEIRAWGIMVSLGVLAGTLVASKLAAKRGISADTIFNYVLYAFISGLLGARIWEVVFSWQNFADNPMAALKFWSGGLSIQGAVAGGLIFTLWFVKRNRLDFWTFADILAPGLVLGQAIGRLGCFLNGDAYGIPTDSWLGVVYKPGTPAYDTYGAVPLVPAELLEGAGDLLIFALLLVLFINRRHFNGLVALVYFVTYSLLRFILEFWRGDSLMIGGLLKAAQISSLVIAAVAVCLILVRARSQKQVRKYP